MRKATKAVPYNGSEPKRPKFKSPVKGDPYRPTKAKAAPRTSRGGSGSKIAQ